MPVDLFFILIALALILPVSFGLGTLFGPWIRTKNSILDGIFYYALGLTVLSYGVAILSLLCPLTSSAIWIFLVILGLTRLRSLPLFLDWWRHLIRDWTAPSSLFSRWLRIYFGIACAGLLMATFAPEIAGDSLCYHLNLPKVFLSSGKLTPNPYDLNSYFPLFMYNLYLIGLATGGAGAAKFFSFFCGFLLVLALKELAYDETKNRTLSLLTAFVVFWTPAVYNQLGTSYIDVSTAFFVFLSLISLFSGFREKRQAFFLVSGLLIGCAVAIKYIAAINVAAILVLWFIKTLKDRSFFLNGKSCFIWLSGALLTGGFWLCRNWIAAGNPVFPYFPSVFGTEMLPTKFESYGLGKTPLHFIFLLWNMFYKPAAFGGFTDRIGIFYFLGIPFLICAALFYAPSRKYLVFILTFLILWFRVAQVDRYILPVLPVITLAAAMGSVWVLSKSGKRIRIFSQGFALALITFYFLSGIYHYRYTFPVYLGYWTPQSYLTKMERTFPIASWANQNLPADSKILLESEARQFYFDRRLIRDAFLKYRTHYDQKKWGMPELAAFLKSKQITHILMSEPAGPRKAERPPTLLGQLAQSGLARKIYTGTSQNLRDAKFVYRLYALK